MLTGALLVPSIRFEFFYLYSSMFGMMLHGTTHSFHIRSPVDGAEVSCHAWKREKLEKEKGCHLAVVSALLSMSIIVAYRWLDLKVRNTHMHAWTHIGFQTQSVNQKIHINKEIHVVWACRMQATYNINTLKYLKTHKTENSTSNTKLMGWIFRERTNLYSISSMHLNVLSYNSLLSSTSFM